jgi:hypothetical protein
VNALRQIFAIARTEFRFGLRRGGPVVTTILIGLIFGAGILMGPLANLPIARDEINQLLQDPVMVERLAQKGLTMEYYRQITAEGMANITVISIPMAWPILLITTFLLLPGAAATGLPADRKFGAAELLHSLPVRGDTYLAGKVLGFMLAAILSGAIPLGLFFVVLDGAFLQALQINIPIELVWFFIKFAALDWLPLVAWAVMIGILAGTPFHTRRAAVFPGLLAGILSIFFWLAVFKSPVLPYTQLDLNAYYLIQNYHSAALDALARAAGETPFPMLGADAPLLGIGRVLLMDSLLVVSLFVLAGLARLWLKWKENF